MKRVFLIISLLCLLPFTMMAQTRSSSYDEKLEQLYGASPYAQQAPRSAFNQGDKGALVDNLGFGFLISGENGAMVSFDPAAPGSPLTLAQYQGYYITAAEVVAQNSTTDIIYAYTSDGRYGTVEPESPFQFTPLNTNVTRTLTEMAYDVTTKTMYGLSYGVIYRVTDLATGAVEPINNSQVGSNNWIALAIDMDGHMYGVVNTYSNNYSELYAINTRNWNCTYVGNMPYKTQYTQSMSFDRDSGNLYWWQISDGGSNLLQVSPADATCTMLLPDNGYQMAGMIFKYAPITYNITYAPVENGIISGPAYAAENDVVTITVAPAYGYRLETLAWNGNAIDVEAGEPYTFTMPDVPVTVTATFALNIHNITVVDPMDGTLATNPAGEATYNSLVEIIPTPDPGFEITNVTYTINGVTTTLTAAPWEFTMPDSDVTVGAQYHQVGNVTFSIADDYYGYFGDIVTVAVELDNDCYVSTMMLDISLGENLTYVPGSIQATDRMAGEGWGLNANVVAGNHLLMDAININLNRIEPGTGAIVTFNVQCAAVASNNVLTINNNAMFVAATPDGTVLNINKEDGALEIKDIVLDPIADQEVTHNQPTEAVVFNSDVPAEDGEVVFAWTNDTPSIGLAVEGTGNIDAFVAQNLTTSPVVATITVTPTLNHNGNPCQGTPVSFTITVNPLIIQITVIDPADGTLACEPADQAYYPSTIIVIPTPDPGFEVESITITPTTGDPIVLTEEPWEFETPLYDVTVSAVYTQVGNVTFSIADDYYGYFDDIVTVSVDLDNECYLGTLMLDISLGENLTYVPASIQAADRMAAEGWGINANPVAGNHLLIDAINVSLNRIEPGTGAILTFDVQCNRVESNNVLGITENAMFVAATPDGTVLNINKVDGALEIKDVVMDQPADQTVCHNTTTEEVVFSTTIDPSEGDITYAWTNDNTEIGLGAAGEGNIPAFVAINNTLVTTVANLTVTPTLIHNGHPCVGSTKEFTITVNPKVVMDTPESQVVCNGAETEAIEFTSPMNEGTMSYTWTNDNTAIGLAAAGEGNIDAFTAVNEGTAPVVANISVIPTISANGIDCPGTAVTFTITVNPTPVMTAVEDKVACNNTTVEAIEFASNITEGEVTYAWINDNVEIGLAAEGEGNIAAFTATNAGGAAIVAHITVTPTYTNNGVSCVGEAISFTITVNPTPVMVAVDDQIVCNNAMVEAIEFASNITDGEVVYAWTNTNAEIGLAAEGEGNIESFTAINAGGAPVVATITVTPTYTNNGVSCVGEAISFTITVNPTPVMVAVEDKVACNNTTVEAIEFASNITEGEVTYVWTNDNVEIGLAAEGEGNIAAFTATNAGGAAIVANITVTPTYTNNGVSCVGDAISFTITVNPTPVMVAVDDIVVCNNGTVDTIEFASNITDGEVVYTWTNTNAEIGLAAEGEGNINAFTAVNAGTAAIVATISVTPTYTNNGISCVGESFSFNITVNPTPVMVAVDNQIVCDNATVEAIEFASNITGTEVTYSWTNDNTEIGLAAAGEGNIDAFTATNSTNAALVATITVTPTYTNNGISCIGEPINFTITVNPIPVMVAVESLEICNTQVVEAIEFATNVTDGEVTYAWTNDNTAIGLGAEGIGNIPSFSAVNTSNDAIVAHIVVTPTYTNGGVSCEGEPITFTITVNPAPAMTPIDNMVVCNNEAVEAIHFTTEVNTLAGIVTYAWTNDNPAIGLAAEGEGDIPAFTAVNTTDAALVATISVIPTFSSARVDCVGAALTFTITVNPTPVMTPVENMAVCQGTSTEAILFETNVTDGEVTYTWTNDNTAIGLAEEGEGDIASFLAVNQTNDALVANITVTPTYTNNGISCEGEAASFTITVYPNVVVDPVADMTFNGRELTDAILFNSNVDPAYVTYDWTNDNPAIGLAAGGQGFIDAFIAAAVTSTTVANITVIPTYTNGNTMCQGEAMTFTITVNPTYLVVCNTPENGTLTDNANVAATGEHYALPGDVITLTATPATNYILENVTVTMLGNNMVVVPVTNNETFVMPEFDVEVTATFIDANDLLIQPAILDMGFRPINAWMFSKFFTVGNYSTDDAEITNIDLSDYTFFSMDDVELPFVLASGESMQFGINTNYKQVEPGAYNAIMALKGAARKTYLRNIVGTAYTAVEPDIWELATNVTNYPYTTTQTTGGVLYDNYQLPGNGPDGYDGVYKLTFDHDVILNAEIVAGNDPKVVVYDQDFRHVGGPHINNYHNAADSFTNEALIGDGSTTTSYMPYYTYYNYSLSQMLYTADELAAAGLQAGVINSIEFMSNSTYCYTRDNVSVWMGNVSEGSVGTTSVSTANMPCVYTGSFTQVVGWNVFEFNGSSFSWDGTSNVLITVAMNHGSYGSGTPWVAHNPGFTAGAYRYNDYNAYYPATATYDMYTSSTARPDIKFNGDEIVVGGTPMGDTPIVDLGLFAGTYYLVASTTSDDSYTLNINAEDMPLPLAPTAIYPLHESTGIPTPVTLEWELGEYTHEYQLVFGLTYPPTEVVVDWTSNLATSYNIGELLHNKVYFWRINERNSSGTTTGPLWAFTTELNVPLNLTIVNDELVEGEDAAELNWVTPEDRTLRGYNVYVDGVKVNTTPVVGNTYSVTGLTYNMDGYDINVTAVYDEGESGYSNTVVAYVTGYSNINGHVYEQDGVTGIAGATVVMIGYDEFQNVVTFEFTTNASGYYSGQLLAGSYLGGATKDGYQPSVNYSFTTFTYAQTVADYDFILNETYYPVGRVIAQEVSDEQVHVYWMWNTPFSAMMVDFSDGQVPADWTVTGNWEVTSSCPSSLWGGSMPNAPFILADSDTPGSGVHITGYFTSPVFDASGSLALTLEFDHYAKASLGDVCEVQVTSDGTTWTTVAAYTGSNVGSWAAPAHATIDLSNYLSASMQIRFFYDDLNGWKYGWAIDNISVTEPLERGDRSFVNYNLYRRNVMNPDQVQTLLQGTDVTEYEDMSWGTLAAGVYEWGVSANYEGNRGESEVVWSNQLDKNMSASLTVNVSTNSNDPVTGALVTFTNVSEPELEISYVIALGEEGTYTWDEIRKGEYTVAIELNGFEPFAATASLWNNANTVNYVLTEIVEEIEGLYVSTTGWAMFGELEPAGPTGGGELTVYEGTSTSSYVPVYGLWVDDFTKCEMIMPATDLSAMTGYYINSMTFYLESPATSSWDPAVFQIFMKEVSMTTLSGYQGADGATVVYEGGLNNQVTEMTINFTTPYRYLGGNLLIGIYGIQEGNYRSTYFYGTQLADGVSASGYNSSSLANVTFNSRNFLPKTTFSYGSSKDDRLVQYYNVKLDGVMEGTTEYPFFQHNVANLNEGDMYTTSVQAVYGTGESEWANFDWMYTPCDNFPGLVDEPTAAWEGENVVLNWTLPGGTGPTPPPTPPTPPTGETYDFETGMQGWTAIDADGDGFNWELGSSLMGTGYGHNASSDLVLSQSYDNTYGVLYPDNYLVSPAITLGGAITFYACAQDNAYAAEHFGVAVSTTSGTSASAFTTIQEWTMTAKEVGAPCPVTRSGNRTQGNWYQYTVDLSAYSGTGYVAIRHFNCSDMFYLDVDDITIGGSSKGNRDMWDYVASFTGTSAGQQGVATDGTYIYTASWQSAPTGGYTFYKYDLTGNFIEGFDIAGATGIRDLTTDGQYFYGTSGGAQIFILDFTTKTLVGTINCSGLTSRHISYDPVRDGFWSGNWSDLALYSRTGALIQNGPAPTSAYGSGYFVDEDNVEHLLLFCQPNSDAKVYDYNITTNTLGSSPVFDFAVTPGFDGIAGGCFIADYNNQLCWFGNCQQDPNLIGIYALGNSTGPTPPPTPPTPGEGVIGVEIFRDGEWIAEVHAPVTSYTDLEPGEPDEYEIRVVWDGDQADWTYYAMSCPQSASVGLPTCQAPDNLQGAYQWNEDGTFGANVSWTYGEAPAGAISESFENGVPSDWSTIDADGDGYGWDATTNPGHTGNCVTSASYINNIGPLTPDNYLITPMVPLSGTFSFWVCAQDAGYPAEHFGVAVSTTNNTSAAAFTTIQEWTLTAKNDAYIVGPRGNRDQGAWYQYSVNLSSYNGQNGYIAIRHFNCTDMFYLNLDDVELSAFKRDVTPTNFKVYRDGTEIATVPYNGDYMYSYFDEAAIGTYEYQVTAVYENGCESDFALTPNLSQNYVSVYVTSVHESDNNVSLYPNPTKGNVRIVAAGMSHITVVSALGQVVYDADIDADMTELHLDNFKDGVYTVRINHANGITVKRVTVVK